VNRACPFHALAAHDGGIRRATGWERASVPEVVKVGTATRAPAPAREGISNNIAEVVAICRREDVRGERLAAGSLWPGSGQGSETGAQRIGELGSQTGCCRTAFFDGGYSAAAGGAYSRAGEAEALVSAENWHEERDRLARLLQAIESGKVTHVDEKDLRQLQATTPENIDALKQRLAELNARLGKS